MGHMLSDGTSSSTAQQLTWTTINNQLLSISINHTLFNGPLSLSSFEALTCWFATRRRRQAQVNIKIIKRHVSIMMVLKFFNSLYYCYYASFVANPSTLSLSHVICDGQFIVVSMSVFYSRKAQSHPNEFSLNSIWSYTKYTRSYTIHTSVEGRERSSSKYAEIQRLRCVHICFCYEPT